MPSRYADLSRDELAVLVPELLLCGHLIDRAAMAWCIAAWGREEMARIAIEEWMAASPVYTRRMQRALGFEGTDVVTIFKGLQLDIGAPPQFMDFRFTLHDRWHGEFALAHCGALMDVEPMGEEYVVSMCHDIEDPTFDATAVATNPRARIRPIHRPPRTAAQKDADRHPHCAWTVTIDPSYPEVAPSEGCLEVARSRAARLELDPIDPVDDGVADYDGPLVSDVDFASFSHSALVRLADEVAIQMHLLDLGFVRALRQRAGDDQVREIALKQLVGIAGLSAGRIARALDLPADTRGAARLLALHPVLNPAAYVDLEQSDRGVILRPSAAHDDDGWLRLLDDARPFRAMVRALDPRLDVIVSVSDAGQEVEVVERSESAAEADEVAVARISTGATFAFSPRRSLPITPV